MCEDIHILILALKVSNIISIKGLELSSLFQERNTSLSDIFLVQDDNLGPNTEKYFLYVAK